mmetsp:Transcript_98695/g.284792  ORF Transcript_98695/g.284792 Transcript_98695/m.284792 type:complete len:207 (+) Transcript_98695:844-1464(+)
MSSGMSTWKSQVLVSPPKGTEQLMNSSVSSKKLPLGSPSYWMETRLTPCESVCTTTPPKSSKPPKLTETNTTRSQDSTNCQLGKVCCAKAFSQGLCDAGNDEVEVLAWGAEPAQTVRPKARWCRGGPSAWSKQNDLASTCGSPRRNSLGTLVDNTSSRGAVRQRVNGLGVGNSFDGNISAVICPNHLRRPAFGESVKLRSKSRSWA